MSRIHTAGLLTLLLAGAASAADPAFTAAQLSETRVAMKDVSRAGAAGKAFVAGTIINATPAKICAALQDYASYPDYMPNTESTRVSSSGAGFAVIDVTLKLPMGKIKKYRLKMTPEVSAERCELAWKLVPWPGLKQDETIVDTSGAWVLVPLPSNPAKTVVNYAVSTDPGPVPLGFGWIVDSLSKDSIPTMLDALRGKVIGK